MSGVAAQPRWQHYVLLRGDRLRRFWQNHLARGERSLLLVLGSGIRPAYVFRCGAGARERRHGRQGRSSRSNCRRARRSPSLTHQDRILQNWTNLEGLVQGRGEITVRPLDFWSAEGRRVSSQRCARPLQFGRRASLDIRMSS